MKKNQRLSIGIIIVLVFMMLAQMIPSFAAETESEKSRDYATFTVSDTKVTAEPFNQTTAGLYFGKASSSNDYCLFVRVDKKAFEESCGTITEYKDKAVIEVYYRVKDETVSDDSNWYSDTAKIVLSDNYTDSSGKEYVYFALNIYDGEVKEDGTVTGLKNMVVGTSYEFVINFCKKTETSKRDILCSSNVTEVTYTEDMYISWRNYFAGKAGVTLNDDGTIAAKSFDIFDILKVPMGFMLSLFYKLIPNYLVAIFLLAIVIKIILFFATGIKQQKGMIKQAMFAPKQRAIQNKYKGRTDQKTMNEMRQEITTAQQEAGISMMGGGCLGMLIQMLILICLYNVIRYPLTYLSNVPTSAMSMIKQYFVTFSGTAYDDITIVKPLTDNFGPVADFLKNNFSFNLSEYVTADTLPNFTLFKGFDMAATPSITNINLLIIVPVLVFVSYYLSMKLTKKMSYQAPTMEGQPDIGKSMKIMDIAMPALSTFICFSVPALLGIYWIFSSLLGIPQQYLLKKMYPYPVFTEEDYKAAEREYKGKQPKAEARHDALSKKSKYDDDDEEYATLENKPSYYDLSDEEKKAIDAKKKAASEAERGKKTKTKMIGKAEMNDSDDKKDTKKQ